MRPLRLTSSVVQQVSQPSCIHSFSSKVMTRRAPNLLDLRQMRVIMLREITGLLEQRHLPEFLVYPDAPPVSLRDAAQPIYHRHARCLELAEQVHRGDRAA